MSTCAPASGTQSAPLIWETRIVNCSGTPSDTLPVPGSERTSDRLSISSTKYGPSVSAGRTTQLGKVATPLAGVMVGTATVAALVVGAAVAAAWVAGTAVLGEVVAADCVLDCAGAQ